MTTVLVVDDDDAMRRLIRLVLGTEGIDVRLANNGAEAIAGVEESRPDAIVLDLMMPVMTGREFLKVAEAREWRIPTLVLSAVAGPELAWNPAVDYLAKPFDTAVLLERMNKLLR